MNISYS